MLALRKIFFIALFLVAINAKGMGTAGSSAAGPSSPSFDMTATTVISPEEVSLAIVHMANTYFTPDKIATAQKTGLLTESAQTFLESAQNIINKVIPAGDALFSQTPGYQEHKQKLLAQIEQFSTLLGYTGPLHTIASISLGHIKTIGELEKKLKDCGYNNEFLYQLSEGTIDRLLTPETIAARSSGITKEQRKKLHDLLLVKRNYLQELRTLYAQGETALAHFYERPEWHLTLEETYQAHLRELSSKLQKTKKNSRHQKHFQEEKTLYVETLEQFSRLNPVAAHCFKTFPKETLALQNKDYYHGFAINMRGALYEIEAALQTHEHGKKVLAFGPEVRLFFNAQTKQKLVEEIQKQPFLRPEVINHHGQTFYSLTQEFDLVTDTLIECKCAEDASAYIENLKREDFISRHIADADKVEVSAQTSSDSIRNKPIVCYIKYSDDFLRKEKKLREEKKVNEEESAATLKGLVERTRKEGRRKESMVADAGFSLWNGDIYQHTLVVSNPYDEMPTIEQLKALKQAIEKIGNNRFVLSIRAAQKHEQLLLNRLKELVNIYPAHATKITGRRHSLPGRQSPSLFPALETGESSAPGSRCASPEPGPLDEMRTPMPLLDIVFCEPVQTEQCSDQESNDSDDELPSAPKNTASPVRPTLVRRRLQTPISLPEPFSTSPRIPLPAERAAQRPVACKKLNFEKNSGR